MGMVEGHYWVYFREVSVDPPHAGNCGRFRESWDRGHFSRASHARGQVREEVTMGEESTAHGPYEREAYS